MGKQRVFTSESVSEGHPDKVADQISDSILDAIFEQDPAARVACETMVNTGMVVISGEITMWFAKPSSGSATTVPIWALTGNLARY